MATKKKVAASRTPRRDTKRKAGASRAAARALEGAPPPANFQGPPPVADQAPDPPPEAPEEEVSEIFSDDTGGLPLSQIQKILVFRPTEVGGKEHLMHVGTAPGALTLARAASIYGGGIHQFRAFNRNVIAVATHLLPGPAKASNGSALAPLQATAEGVMSVSTDPNTAALFGVFQTWISVMRDDFKQALESQHATNILLTDLLKETHSNTKVDKFLEVLISHTEGLKAENERLRQNEQENVKKKIELALKEAKLDGSDGDAPSSLEKWLKLAQLAPEVLKAFPGLAKPAAQLGAAMFGGAAPAELPGPGLGPAPPLNGSGQ